MADMKPKIALCTVCVFKQYVMADFADDKMYCQRCGNRFDLNRRTLDQIYPRIGKLAVNYNFINDEQLKEALSSQGEENVFGRYTPLEDIFIRLKMISPKQARVLHSVDKYYDIRQQDKEFADMVVKAGYASFSEVAKARELQTAEFRGKKLIKLVGDILVENNAITEDQRDGLFCVQGRKEKETPPKSVAMEEVKPALLSFSDNCMKAVLDVDPIAAKKIFLGQVKKLLGNRNVSYGIVDDETIDDFLQKGGRLEIAHGKLPVSGADASVQYFFDTDYLQAGTIDEEGNIDFKDRGEIPFIKKGVVLARKIPIQRPIDGIDIMGRLVTAEEASDMELSCGSGAEFGEDPFTVIASTDGQPSVSMSGKVSVFKETQISGNVDFKTGHIDFQGNVKILGTIKNGFHVKGITIHAKEIVGGEVDAGGDFLVTDGIIDAKIRAKGNVYATFIKNSIIAAYGNIVVEREILDSEITTSGFCQVQNGNILSSTISAKKGIYAPEIGNEILQPNILKIGVDDNAGNEIKLIKKRIKEKKRIFSKLEAEATKAENQISEVYDKIAAMAYEQDLAERERKLIANTLERFNKKKGKRKLDHAEAKLNEFDERIHTAEETITKFFSQESVLKDKIAKSKNKKMELEDEIQELLMEKEGIDRWAKTNQSVSLIRVAGSITSRTSIQGFHSQKILKDTFQNVQIKEVFVTDPGGRPYWDIQVIKI